MCLSMFRSMLTSSRLLCISMLCLMAAGLELDWISVRLLVGLVRLEVV